jgi:ribonuclease D
MKGATKVGLLGATFLTAFGLAAPAAAQDATDDCPVGTTRAADGTCEEEDESIVVTGSRLRNTALQVAAAWRERQAQQRDVPRGRIVKDEALYEIAEHRPKTAADFDRMRAVPRGFGNSRAAQDLVQALDRAFGDPNRPHFKYERPPPVPPGLGPTVELLKVLLRYEADAHEVAPRLIASAAEVEAIAASDDADVPALRGWRRTVFGERALALKHGKIALKLKSGKVAIKEL